jgi:hypothetical protein
MLLWRELRLLIHGSDGQYTYWRGLVAAIGVCADLHTVLELVCTVACGCVGAVAQQEDGR